MQIMVTVVMIKVMSVMVSRYSDDCDLHGVFCFIVCVCGVWLSQ